MQSSRGLPKRVLCAALLATMWLAPLAARGTDPKDILIIVNTHVPVDALDKEHVKNLFLKKQTFWARSGGRVVPVHAKTGSELRNDFLERALGMSAAEEDSHWRTSQIQKGVTRPPEFSNTLKAVFSLKRSVSYVYRSDFKGSFVKIVHILPAQPKREQAPQLNPPK